jgi:hypothetical protein
MELNNVIAQWETLGAMFERTQDQEFEFDALNAMWQMLHVIDAFDKGRRKANKSRDLDEIIHYTEFALKTLTHCRDYFAAKEEEARPKPNPDTALDECFLTFKASFCDDCSVNTNCTVYKQWLASKDPDQIPDPQEAQE